MKEKQINSTETKNTYLWITMDHPGNFRWIHIKEAKCYKSNLIEGSVYGLESKRKKKLLSY